MGWCSETIFEAVLYLVVMHRFNGDYDKEWQSAEGATILAQKKENKELDKDKGPVKLNEELSMHNLLSRVQSFKSLQAAHCLVKLRHKDKLNSCVTHHKCRKVWSAVHIS